MELEPAIALAKLGAGDLQMIDADRDIENADWLRPGAWDIWTADDPPRLVTTLEDLRRAIGGPLPATDAAIRRFVALPAARAMPATLRSELNRR